MSKNYNFEANNLCVQFDDKQNFNSYFKDPSVL